jgi:hypothetical protein
MANLSKSVCSTANAPQNLGLNLSLIPIGMLMTHSGGGKHAGRPVCCGDHFHALGGCLLTEHFRQIIVDDLDIPWVNLPGHNEISRLSRLNYNPFRPNAAPRYGYNHTEQIVE